MWSVGMDAALQHCRTTYLTSLEGEDQRDLVSSNLLVGDLRGHPALGGVGLPGTGADVEDVRHGVCVWWSVVAVVAVAVAVVMAAARADLVRVQVSLCLYGGQARVRLK